MYYHSFSDKSTSKRGVKKEIYEENLKSIAIMLKKPVFIMEQDCKVVEVVEPSGIEPPFMPCESIVLPLNHGPVR